MKKLALVTIVALITFLVPRAMVRADGSPPVVDDMYHAVTTMRDVNSLGIALEAYWKDHKSYPQVSNMTGCVNLLMPRYAARLETHDAWGTEIRYLPASDYQDYRLVSAGSDRVFDDKSWGVPGVFTDSKQDVVFSGRFLRKWAINFL